MDRPEHAPRATPTGTANANVASSVRPNATEDVPVRKSRALGTLRVLRMYQYQPTCRPEFQARGRTGWLLATHGARGQGRHVVPSERHAMKFLGAVAGVLGVYLLRDVLVSFLVATALACVLNPLADTATRRLGWSRVTTVSGLTLGLLRALGALFYHAVPVMTAAGRDLAAEVPHYLQVVERVFPVDRAAPRRAPTSSRLASTARGSGSTTSSMRPSSETVRGPATTASTRRAGSSAKESG